MGRGSPIEKSNAPDHVNNIDIPDAKRSRSAEGRNRDEGCRQKQKASRRGPGSWCEL